MGYIILGRLKYDFICNSNIQDLRHTNHILELLGSKFGRQVNMYHLGKRHFLQYLDHVLLDFNSMVIHKVVAEKFDYSLYDGSQQSLQERLDRRLTFAFE